MKKIVFFAILLSSCDFKHEPEFYINGKPCYTRNRCVKSHVESKLEYHYGYNFLTSKFEWHIGNNDVTICDEYQTDTIEIK